MKYISIILILFFTGCTSKKAIVQKPLIVFLHGYGDNETQFAEFSKTFKGDYDTMLIRGFFDLKDDNYSFGELNYNEIDNTWFDKKDGLYSVYKLKDILKSETYKKIIIFGYSQGASLGYAMLLNYPEKFKTLVAINGYIDKNLLIERYKLDYDSLNILRLNGADDFLINSRMIEFSNNYLDSLKIQNTFIEHKDGHSFTDEHLKTAKEWILKTN